jgi:hypothetical protein
LAELIELSIEQSIPWYRTTIFCPLSLDQIISLINENKIQTTTGSMGSRARIVENGGGL